MQFGGSSKETSISLSNLLLGSLDRYCIGGGGKGVGKGGGGVSRWMDGRRHIIHTQSTPRVNT